MICKIFASMDYELTVHTKTDTEESLCKNNYASPQLFLLNIAKNITIAFKNTMISKFLK